MAENDLREIWVGDVAEQGFHLHIREVAVARGDALLDRPRALCICLKELVIVIRLDKKRGKAT